MRTWSLSAEEVLAELDSSEHGLGAEEADRRLERWGRVLWERIAIVGALMAAGVLAFIRFALRFEPFGLSTWAVIVATALSVIVAVEIHKRVRRPGQAASGMTRAE